MSSLPNNDLSDDEAVVLTEEEKQLEAMYKERQNKLLKRCPSIIDKWNWHMKTRTNIQLHTLLYDIGPLGTYPTFGMANSTSPLSRNNVLIWVNPTSVISVNLGFISNKHVFLYEWNSTGIVMRPIYTFNHKLTAKDMQLIDNLYRQKRDANTTDIAGKFESVIRLIPGSYQNGSWRQLGGFFGMYYNDTTSELSTLPPPL